MICLGVSTRLVLSTGTRMTTYRVRQEHVGQARAKRSLAPEGQGTNGPRINSHQSSKDAGLGRDAGRRTSCLVCLSNAHGCNGARHSDTAWRDQHVISWDVRPSPRRQPQIGRLPADPPAMLADISQPSGRVAGRSRVDVSRAVYISKTT